MTEFHALQSKRLSASAADQVMQLVRSGQLPPGTKLPSERELMVMLGVSRNSLREGVRILETMGVLRVERGRGTWVREDFGESKVNLGSDWLSSHARDVMDLLEMRETLEIRAAELVAERGTEEQVRLIVGRLEELQVAVATRDPDAVIVADAALHRAIAEGSGNHILARALDDLQDLAMDTRRAVTSIRGRLDRAITEHEAIVNAIAERDANAAGRAMRQHVRRVIEEARAAVARGSSEV